MKKILIICLVLLSCNLLYSQTGNWRFLQSSIGVDYIAQRIDIGIESANQNLAVIRGQINQFLAAGRVNWVRVTYIQANVVTLMIAENNTPNERHCEIGRQGEGNYLHISQGGKVDLKNFNVSAPAIIPGMLSSVYLSGSEVGVTYKLNGMGVLESKNGTGGPLVFEGNFPAGTYQVIAYKGNSFLKMGKDVQIQMSLVINNIRFSKSSITLPSSGGSENVKVIFNTQKVPKETLVAQLQAICQSCSSGKVSTWNEFIKIYYRPDDFLVIAAKPSGPSGRRGSLALGQTFAVIQPGGEIQKFQVTGKEYVYPEEKFSIRLSGSQYFRYVLYCDGVQVSSQLGTQGPLVFENLSQLGTYTVKALYEDNLINMIGEVTVKNRDGLSNYIATKTFSDANKYVRDITFLDDLGRVVQKTNLGATPSGKDLITPVQYDNSGRTSRIFLPYVSQSGDRLHDKNEEKQSNYYTSIYGTNHYAYSDVVYDNSPKDQVIEQSSPGASWRLGGGHTMRTKIRTNTAKDNIRRCISINSSVLLLGNYRAHSLSVKQKTNQEYKQSYEYYDGEGRLIAKESRVSDSKRYLTLYVYNTAGRLSHIIPPELTRQIMEEKAANVEKKWADLAKYCYYMEYDKYGNIYKQYVPGAGYTITLYDKRGRMVLSQDARQRSQSPEMWSFTKYDELNRPVISGICNGTEADHTTALAAQTVFGEARGNALHGYTNRVYPTAVTSDNCLMVSYYDDYSWPGQNLVAYSATDALGAVKSDAVIGLQTGQKKKVLGNPAAQWLLSASYYDADYQAVQSVAQLYPSGTEIVTNIHDFTGQVVRTKVKQTVGAVVTEYNKYFTFDHRGRLLKIEQEITGDSQGRVTLAAYTYDELGRRQGKKLHNGLYDASYTYNVAGETTGFTSRDLTWMLSYDELPVPSGNATAKYDGNISCLRWKNGSGAFRAYTYKYDGLGQLLQADYNEQAGAAWSNPSGKYNVGGLSYDDNGNLKTLVRKNGSGSDLHNLGYQYNVGNNGNAVGNITMNGQLSGSYVYDANGNLQTDGYKGYQIVYNELNLPAEISKGSEKISYIYSASGEKLAMKAGSSLTYYRGVMVYNGNAISYMLHPEGTVQRSSNGWVYNYRLTDHTGSTRVLLEKGSTGLTAVQTNEYYPFGLSFAYNNLNRNKFLFSGKEYQDGQLGGEMLGLYDFGARMYNPMLGRWFCQDPALQLVSPYGFCGNNPVCYVDPNGESFIAAIFIGAFMNTFMQGMAGNINSAGDFWKSFGIGALSGAAGFGASLGVSNMLSASASIGGGFIGGALSGGAGGLAGGFVGGAGSAWSSGASFTEGLRAGATSGGVGMALGALGGGLARGIGDARQGYSFWNGKGGIEEILAGSTIEEGYVNYAKEYNQSAVATEQSDMLKLRVMDHYNIKEGEMGIKEITTKTGGNYGLTRNMKYVNLKTRALVNGYLESTSNGSFVHICPEITNNINFTHFRSVVGHELIHAYHHYVLGGSYIRALSESIAYKYTVNEYMRGGYYGEAIKAMNMAISLGYWGLNTPSYEIPFSYSFY